MMTYLPSSPRSAAACAAASRTKSGRPSRSSSLQHQLPRLLVRQDVLAEQRVQRRQPLRDRRHAQLGVFAQRGAAAHEAQIAALQQAHLVGRQAQLVALGVERRRRGRTRRGSARSSRCTAPAWGCSRGRSPQAPRWWAGVQVEEHRAHPVRATGPALHRLDRVGEVGASAEPAMASKSASPSSMPRSSAGGKCSGLIRSKGGKPNAFVQGEKKGFPADINAS